MTPAQVQTAFDSTGKLGFSIMRLSIPPDSTQFTANAPSAKLAESLGAKIIATPWTPPAWMKSNNSQVGGMLLPANYAAYAAHLKAFADTMAAYGVSLYGISVQNEPDFNASYQSCLWNATQFLNFMRYNAPSVGVPVFMPESESFQSSIVGLDTKRLPRCCAYSFYRRTHLWSNSFNVSSCFQQRKRAVDDRISDK